MTKTTNANFDFLPVKNDQRKRMNWPALTYIFKSLKGKVKNQCDWIDLSWTFNTSADIKNFYNRWFQFKKD